MNAMTPSVAKEVGNATSAGNNRTCSDGRSRKNKYSSKKLGTRDRVAEKELLCYGHR